MVTRRRHPLEGQTLAVLGRMRRHGTVELLVVLADGSKTLLPASWTDLAPSGDVGHAVGEPFTVTLGSLGDLLAASALMSVLAVRAGGDDPGQAARQPPCKEDDRATCPVEVDARGGTAASPEPGRGVPARPARRRDRGAGTADRQGHLDAKQPDNNQGRRRS